MTTRAKGPLAGLEWLKRGINLGRQNPRAIFGGAALVATSALVPSLLQLFLQSILQPGPDGLLALVTVITVLSMMVMPLVIGGYLRVIDAAEQGRPTRASDVFVPFKPGHDRGRLIGFGVVVATIYLALAFAIVSLLGHGFFDWYSKMLELTQQGQPIDPKMVPPLPEGLGPVVGVGSIVALFLVSVYAIGFGQVALGGQSIGRALADGLAGTLKNLLPLLVLAVLTFAAMFALMLVFGLVIALVMAIGGMVHPVLAALLALPVYLALLLLVYVVMFGVMYYLWRDVAGPEQTPAVMPPGHIEL